MSALVWDYWEERRSWRGIFNKYISASAKVEVSIWGTTLSPHYEIKN